VAIYSNTGCRVIDQGTEQFVKSGAPAKTNRPPRRFTDNCMAEFPDRLVPALYRQPECWSK